MQNKAVEDVRKDTKATAKNIKKDVEDATNTTKKNSNETKKTVQKTANENIKKNKKNIKTKQVDLAGNDVVNVKNNTVITAIDSKSSNENVFTNIDGAVIVQLDLMGAIGF